MRQTPWWLPAALLLFAAPVMAQFAVFDEQGAGPKNPPIPITKLKVQPAKVPIPALKYRLMPEARDLKPGNAVTKYYRAFSPEWQFFQKDKDYWKHAEKWEEDGTKPPPEWFKFVLNFAALHEIDQGARRTYCDWEMLDAIRKDGIAFLLPDIQSFRAYMLLLQARARFEMLDKKFGKAIYTLQTSFSFARHISEGPTLIQALVGASMANVSLGEIEQFMQQSGSPNLYWALTDLPKPFIDLKKSLQGEKLLIDSLFPGWRELAQDLDAKPMSPQEFDAHLGKIFELLQLTGLTAFENQLWRTKLGLAFLAAKAYPEARKFLLDQGRPAKIVDKMSVAQVALLYEIYNYDRIYDDMVKWYGLPYAQMRKGVQKVVNELMTEKARATAVGNTLALLLIPAVEKVFYASYRTDRKIALLRCVEAIRLHAASHGGKLPAALKDITEVPVPNDPYFSSPFEYVVGENSATLTAPPPAGETPNLGNSWIYEITMKP